MQVQNWGTIDYSEAYQRQRQCVAMVIDGKPDQLIFCEHPSVITLGRMTKPDSLIFPKEEIKAQGIGLFPIDRGGDVSMHMPGQLVVYVIMDLKRQGKDLKDFMQGLEKVAVDLLKDFGILAESIEGKRGVFVGPKKIISIGVGVRKWVTFHGLGINVNNDLSLYRYIKPCGLDVQMTSMEKQSKQPIPMRDVIQGFERNFKKYFGVV